MFKQFEIGTIRGPFSCGPYYGNRPSRQFAVRGPDGWRYFIDKDEAVARKQAEECSKELLEAQVKPLS